MHIMHVIDQLGRGGAERMLVDLANQSVRDGHRVSVCVTRAGGPMRTALAPSVSVVELNRASKFDLPAMRRLSDAAAKLGVDVAHVHGRSSFSLLVAMRTLGLFTTPILLHDHFGIELDEAVPHWFRLWGRRYVDHYVGVYDALGRWAVAAGVPANRVSVIGNAIDLQRLHLSGHVRIREAYGFPAGALVGVVVAGIRYEKGIDIFLRAVARLDRDGLDRWIVVGGARDAHYARKCKMLAETLGLQQRVMFTGECDHVPVLLADVDLGVVPSRSESGPLVLIEYMAAGLPFVATHVGDVAHRVARRGGEAFVPPEDEEALVRALEALLREAPAARRRRGEAGRRLTAELFDVGTVIEEWYRIYSRLAGVA